MAVCVVTADYQHLIGQSRPNNGLCAPVYNNRTMSDHELIVFEDDGQTLFTWNLLDQKELCAGGYYNNPWGETECVDTATHRQHREMQRLHKAIADAAKPTRAVSLQECMLPNTELGFDDTQWSLHRAGQLVVAVHDLNAMRIKWSANTAFAARCPRFITSEGDDRAVFVYSPKYKTIFVGVHLKWMNAEDSDAVDETAEEWRLLCNYAIDVFNTRQMFVLGDFNMINDKQSGIKNGVSLQTFIAATADMWRYGCCTPHVPAEYTNVHRDSLDSGTEPVEACTSSDYVLHFDISIPREGHEKGVPIVDSDLIVVPPELRPYMQLGTVITIKGKTLDIDTELPTENKSGWQMYEPVFTLLYYERAAEWRCFEEGVVAPSYVIGVQDRRLLFVQPTFCCALDLAAFAKEQLEDLPNGDHIVVVAMYGGKNVLGTSIEPVAVALATLTITTTARTDGVELVYERAWTYSPLSTAVISELQTQHTFVINSNAIAVAKRVVR